MRQLLSELSNRLQLKLLHCDMFPYKHKYTIDMGLGESNALNVAYGISKFEPVLIYGVCGFLLHRFEPLLHNLRFAEHPVLLFNAGGSNNPCYSNFGWGHTCFEDIKLAEILKIPVYTPKYEDFEETCLKLLQLGGLKLIRLT